MLFFYGIIRKRELAAGRYMSLAVSSCSRSTFSATKDTIWNLSDTFPVKPICQTIRSWLFMRHLRRSPGNKNSFSHRLSLFQRTEPFPFFIQDFALLDKNKKLPGKTEIVTAELHLCECGVQDNGCLINKGDYQK